MIFQLCKGRSLEPYCSLGMSTSVDPMVPFPLNVTAGTMIFMVAEAVVPELQIGNNRDITSMGLMFGFTVLMVLDVTLD